jgi:pimeloyl-ACP methyl ester carboxylesterase
MSTLNETRSPCKRYRLGLIYVHGIGEQKRGEVASAFSDACHGWVQHRISGISEGHAQRGTTRETLARAAPRAMQVPDIHAPRSDLRQHLAFLEAAHLFVPEADLLADGVTPVSAPEGEPMLATVELTAVPPSDERAPRAFALELDWTDTFGRQHASDWLLAESWWADKCAVPSIWQLLTWAPRAVPTAIAVHLFSQFLRDQKTRSDWHRRWLEIRSWLYVAASILATILLAPLVYLLVGLVGIGSWIPVPRIKDPALAVRFLLTRIIGDVFVFSESSAQHAAIISSVQRDLDWLAEQCDSIVVVGHSQGAMLAYQACRQRPDNVQVLITMGSGIRKLRALSNFAQHIEHPAYSFANATLIWANVLSVTACIALGLSLTGQLSASMAFLVGLVAGGVAASLGLLGFSLFATSATQISPADRFWDKQMQGPTPPAWTVEDIDHSVVIHPPPFLLAGTMKWLDLIATRDPVAAGVTYGSVQTGWRHDPASSSPIGPWPSSYSVTNARSLLLDHTGYLNNRDECISAIVHEAAMLDDTAYQWLVPDAYRSRLPYNILVDEGTHKAPICHARARIIARASLANFALMLVIFAFMAFHCANATTFSLSKWNWPWIPPGLEWQDLAIVTLLISAGAGVRSARIYALQRLATAVFERRNWCAKRDTDGAIRLVDTAFGRYGRVSMAEGLGLAISVSIPAMAFALVPIANGPTAALWTIVTVPVAHSIAAFLRLRENGSDLRCCYGEVRSASAGKHS